MEERDFREPWWFRHPYMAVLLAFMAVLAVGAAVWGAKVALSPVKGAGDVIIEQNDAKNMINAQRELQQRYAGLKAACQKIDIAKAAVEADPENYVAKTNYTSTKLHYVNLVGEYNALTQQLLAKNMLGDLPERVSPDNCTGVN
jgi:hypothetical protein